MLEHFIVLLLDGTHVTPYMWELEPTVMAIQHNCTQSWN